MAQVYANLIRKGLKTIEDVPAEKRAEVEAILNAQNSNR
ncbi:CD1375 family protein [Cohnella hongkongensis]|uniref:CD1375 family protein n=1 Tax=Cohnella hongkongensis TaxID=178337 RepID=A0ABV9FDF8_9BACL